MGEKAGTGELTPFKKGHTGSTTIKNTVVGAYREGFMDYCDFTEASENVTKLVPFKTGPEAPGRNTNPDHPSFRERDPGIPTFPAFSKKECRRS